MKRKERINLSEYGLLSTKNVQIIEKIMSKKSISGVDVLDCGSGRGILSKKLKNLGFKVTACDINIKPLEKIDLIDKVELDLNKKLPFKDNTFDYICCTEVIQYLDNQRKLINEFSRIIKDDGTLFLSFPNIHSFESRIRFFRYGQLKGVDEFMNAQSLFTILRFMSDCGFKSPKFHRTLRIKNRSWSKRFLWNAISFLRPLMKSTDSNIIEGHTIFMEVRKSD